MDSACPNQMTDNKNLCRSIADFNGVKIQFRENSMGTINGKGTIFFNESFIIRNVYLVKELKYIDKT